MVSIIIPVYKVEEYINECVDSIINQTFSDIEIILVDDGSPDECPGICDHYKEKDTRIHVIHQKNKGLSGARNAGLEYAQGDYVAFVDSDDVIDKDYIRSLFDACEETGCEIAMCDYMTFRKDLHMLPEIKTVYEKKTKEDALQKYAIGQDLRYVVTWNKLFKRSLFNDIRFPERKINEDEFTTYRLFYKTENVVVVNRILYYYRKRPDSIMGRLFSYARLDKIDALKGARHFFSRHSMHQQAENVGIRLYAEYGYCIRGMKQVYSNDLETIQRLERQLKVLKKKLPEKRPEPPVSFVFPFDKVPSGKKLVIYGAGFLGRDYYKQLAAIDYCADLFMVDKYNAGSSYAVESIDRIFSREYDHLILGIRDHDVASQVKRMLVEMGVPDDKIVWHKPEIENIEISRVYVDAHRRISMCKGVDCRKVYLMNTADHGNMGDHALSIAALQFLKDTFPERQAVEYTGIQWERYKKDIISEVKSNEPIFIVGGGYMGSLWKNEDERVKDIIRHFPDNKIIMLPQTFYYYEDAVNDIETDRVFYNENENVLVMHREENSYKWFVDNILADVKRNFLFPDMALSVHPLHKDMGKRSGILLCFRSDKESRVNEGEAGHVKTVIESIGEDYKMFDTVVDHYVLPNDRESELYGILTRISRSKLMITDRLHGMVFATITGTPCIAINNVSKKIEGVYKWINKCPSTVCVEWGDISSSLVQKYANMTNTRYEMSDLNEHFQRAADICRSYCDDL